MNDKIDIKLMAQLLGRAGGKKTAERGSEYYREIAKISHATRRDNKRLIHNKNIDKNISII